MRSLMPKNQKNFSTVGSTVDSRKLVIWNCSISWTISLVPYPLRMRLVNLKRSFFHLKLLSKYIPKIQKFYVLVRFLFKFLLTNNTLKTESWHLLNGPLTISLWVWNERLWKISRMRMGCLTKTLQQNMMFLGKLFRYSLKAKINS